MKSQKVRNLLFDLGNVIIDIDIDGAMQRLYNLLRTDADQKIIDRILKEYECGRVSTDIFINSILSQSHIKTQATHVIEAWNSMLIGIPEYRLEMLTMLRQDFNVYLLSNTNELHIEWIHRYLLRVHGVKNFEKEYFDQAFYSHLIGDRKPQASLFRYIIDEALMTPGLTLFMDDLLENIDVAAKLGFQTYHVRPEVDVAEYLKVEGYY